MPSTLPTFDAIVIGGGPAGLSAALSLGRATRRVLLAACGAPRNAPARASHNVFTRDGTAPHDLCRIGREQLAPYDVVIRDACVTHARPAESEFIVALESGEVRARGLVLATGVRDVLPDVPGFEELWGSGVFHCPYCHGWELAHRPLAIYGRGEAALHLAKLIRGWTDDLILFTDGPTELEPDDEQRIRSRGIVIREDPVARLVGSNGLETVILENGEGIRRSGIFIRPKQELRSDLPHTLGCALTPDGRVQADALGRTSVPRVVVPAVLLFNTVMGFFYFFAAVLIVRSVEMGRVAAGAIAIVNVAVWTLIIVHRASGGTVPNETVGAMTLRTIVWVGIFAVMSRRCGAAT